MGVDMVIDAAAAIASLAGVWVALYLASNGKKEAEKQRQSDKDAKRADRKAIIREACSASDQVAAYVGVLPRLLEKFGSPLSFAAMERIREHLLTLSEMLEILARRTELSDGAMTASVTARRTALEALKSIDRIENLSRNDWSRVADQLRQLKTSLEIISQRSLDVRRAYELSGSSAAETITNKYSELLAKLSSSDNPNEAPEFPQLTTTRY